MGIERKISPLIFDSMFGQFSVDSIFHSNDDVSSKKNPENPSLNTFCCYQKASFHYINNHFQFSLMSLFQFSIQSKQENFLHTHIGLLCNIHKFRCKDFERGLMLKKYCTIG